MVITCGLSLGLPPDPHTLHQLHISSVAYRAAVLALLIPYGAIWYAAFYAFTKLRQYSHAIKGFEDGKAFRSITIGMGVLSFGLVTPATLTQITQYIVSRHPGFKPASVVITDYSNLLLTLIAFVYINNGTHVLARLTKNRPGLMGLRTFALLFIILVSAFTYLVMNYHVGHNVYYLNTPLLLLTFIIPGLFVWFVALLSAYEFGLYAKFAEGLLYRQALRRFAYGIAIMIAGSVATQFVENTFVAVKVGQSLGILLLVEYVLLAVYVLGLILMALGAKKLKKIEEV